MGILDMFLGTHFRFWLGWRREKWIV